MKQELKAKLMHVLLVDDHELILEGMARLVDSIDGFRVVGTAGNGKIALQMLDVLKPDMVLMDVDMPVMNGLEATERIRELQPEVGILILTMHNEEALLKRMKQLGADGFILKNADRESFVEALGCIAKGGQYFEEPTIKTGSMTGMGQSQNPESNEDTRLLMLLSQRETEILRHIAGGLSNKEIGELLFISHRTVDSHRTSIMKKLDVHNVAGLVRIALRNGMIAGS